jgi:RNA polymerase sigma-70 factor (ECF subfamily)
MGEAESKARGVDEAAQRDAELVARARNGDTRALDELFGRHRQAAYTVAYRLLGNAEDALDAVQEAFIHAMRGLPGFRGQSSFRTWFYRIVTHAALDYRRWRSLRAAGSLDAEGAPEPAATGPRRRSPPEEAAAADLREAIDKALANVSEKNRAALVLFALEGMSYQEVADVLGISIGTVMSRIFNARQRLRGLLASEIG